MAQFRKFLAGSGTEKMPVELDIVEDWLDDDEIEPEYKRSKPSPSPVHQQWNSSNEAQYNPLDPSPLGLRLKKTTSLLELIQMQLDSSNVADPRESQKERKQLKASNFCASILRIGSWEYKSTHEGDLVVKCYFGKEKLIWEILQGGLKSKMEMQWSDITALNANFPEDGPGTLYIVLARPPFFFKETSLQPRKHTVWQATSDFTNSQAASIYREHFIQCPQGALHKNVDMIIQCNTRLNVLSQQPLVALDTPYFEGARIIEEAKITSETDYEVMLEDIAQYLLSDETPITPSEEKCLVSRVNSLGCLLQIEPICIEEPCDVPSMQQCDVNPSPAIARKDSFADLLFHLPRIASLPKFMFDISEEEMVNEQPKEWF